MSRIGRTRWVIPDMYWPEVTSEGHYVSHEAICVLNAEKQEVRVRIQAYFQDRDPMDFPPVICPAERTNHIRMDALNAEMGIAPGTCYAAIIESDLPVVIQYTRVDTTQTANAMITTMACRVD